MNGDAGSATTKDLEALAREYGEAWNDHDLDAICAMHSDDVVLRLGGTGATAEVSGLDKVRAVYGYLLAAWPDQRIATEEVTVDGDLCFLKSTLTGTLSAPWTMGSETFEPGGPPVSFGMVDLLQFREGKIHCKTSVVDGIAIREQLGR